MAYTTENTIKQLVLTQYVMNNYEYLQESRTICNRRTHG